MRAIPILLLGATLLLSACSGSPEVTVESARTPDPAADAVAAVFLTIVNDGGGADTLVGASSDVSARAEIHETVTAGGAASMRPVSSVDVPAGTSVRFEPGGLHVMLLGLSGPLDTGDEFWLVLHFERSGEVAVPVRVVDPASVLEG